MRFAKVHSPLSVSVLAALVIATLAVLSAGTVRADAPLHSAEAETFTRDVHVVVGASLRNPDETTNPGASLFNVAGVPLGVTWGDWQQATATVTTHDVGNGPTARTDVRLNSPG